MLKGRCQSVVNGAVILLLAVMLALFGLSLSAPEADAVSRTDLAISDAESAVASSKISLDEAQSRLDAISAEYNALNAEIDEMQLEIDKLADQVLAAQQAMLNGRESLSSTAVYEYRNDTVSAILNVLLGSENLSQLTTNMDYIAMIMDHQAEEIATQKELKSNLETVSDELTAQKSEQEAKLVELDQKQSEAQSVVSRISDEYAANNEKLSSLRAQAEALKRAEAAATQQIVPDSTTVNRPNSGTSGGSSSGGTNAGGGGSAGGSAQGGSTSGEGWRTGRATAYGGSSDPGTPNPGKTATGAICDDFSVGVAVPMSWSNYRSYFGRTVQIVYNGQTVYAPVNDCGGMRGGYISLDLQPGVFKAFGFGSCQAWGVRTVQYRFL